RRRDRLAEGDVDVGLTRRSDREPAIAAVLVERRVLAYLQAELLRVEPLPLVLVVHPYPEVGDRIDHVAPLRRSTTGPRLVRRWRAVFSKRAISRIAGPPRPGHRRAQGNPVGGRGV